MKTIFVTKTEYLQDYTVAVYFSDGARQTIDLRPQIEEIRVPDYKKYQEVEQFKNFSIENGNLVWGEDWDLIFPVDQLHQGKIS